MTDGSKSFLFRMGNGNDGNYPMSVISLKHKDSPYAALTALVVNEYVLKSKQRRYVIKNIEVDGDANHSVYASVYDGPNGETEFGASYLTAELEPVKDEDLKFLSNKYGFYEIRSILDSSALRLFRKNNK